MSDLRTEQQHPEVPVIIIERDDEEVKAVSPSPGRRRTWWRWAVAALVALACVAALLAWYENYKEYRVGIPISTTPTQNIEKLKQAAKAEPAQVVMSSDSIIGVALDFYALHGLKASLQFEEPDTADASVYLYSRCADHMADGNFIGSLVADGKTLQDDRSRLGYMAMADGRMVIGVSRSDKVKDYVVERGGSFFRQFILVSNGVIPTRFYLHGKVERRAIGRMGDTLYYIATRHKESLWDFADALREFGFVDAIYLTGGNRRCFYRSVDGERHDIGTDDGSRHGNGENRIAWLVFRK